MTLLRFDILLAEASIEPAEVRLLRHQTRLPDGRTPLELWRMDHEGFERWQSYQLTAQRAWFAGKWWASFMGLHDGRTLFAGLYEVGSPEPVTTSFTLADTGQTIGAGVDDHYPITLSDRLSAYAGKLYIDWGGGASGKRAWKQRADRGDKIITELHLEGDEAPYPGHMQLIAPVSHIAEAPPSWIVQLEAARGIYLLTCPRTGMLYVGSATGSRGFWGRWMNYEADGHGGNVALRTHERADWLVSILQVAGSADSLDTILAMENLWIAKLKSRMFGLNRNGGRQ